MDKPERSVYTPQDFLAWRESGVLSLTPKFQRRGVWTPAARSFFIDSLLRTMPVPPIYIRNVQNADKTKIIHEIIDGQQRISCVLDYIDLKFRLSTTVPGAWGGKTFDKLNETERNEITTYSFSTEIFRGITDEKVLEIFARLNTYSVPLNQQELRNGRYFGRFKQCAYSLAYEHLEFWRRQGIFAERAIARMLEVEFTSELVIAELDGMQDKKKSIDDFYKNYDEKFEQEDQIRRRFRSVIDTISESFEDYLQDTEFHRAPLFYTLFCVVYHHVWGLPRSDMATPRKPLGRTQKLALVEAAQSLSEPIRQGRAGESVPKRYEQFVVACLRQTDNIRPRQERFRVLYDRSFGSG